MENRKALYYLLKAEISGIKNIDSPIHLDFYPDIIKDKIDFNHNNVKGIYGCNGAGKTAIITAFYIYQRVLSSDNYLLQENVIYNLKNEINYKTKKFTISLVFGLGLDGSCLRVMKHELTIKLVHDIPTIFEEKLFVLNSVKKSLSDPTNYTLLAENSHGEFIPHFDIDEDDKKLFAFSPRDLASNSFVTLFTLAFFDALIKNKAKLKITKDNDNNIAPIEGWPFVFINTYLFGFNIEASLLNEDIHEKSLETMKSKVEYEMKKMAEYLPIDETSVSFAFTPFSADEILKTNYDKYLEKVNKLEKFIKIFKPELKEIKIHRKQNKEYYLCAKSFVYDEYEVSSEFESAGLKKLISIFNVLERAASGAIVFIDELDHSINSVYLNALIEFFQEYGAGQLIFTTHNLEPMNVLNKHKYAIDILNGDHEIYTWTSNGNYSPLNQYKSGMTPGSPFNISSDDFLTCFSYEEK